MKIKIISLVTLLCMLFSFLIACDKESDLPVDESSSEYESVSETVPLDESLSVIENGKTNFVLVRPKDVDSKTLDLILNFNSTFEKRTGIKLEIKFETEENAVNADYEILIGETLRPESIEISKDLKYKEFFLGAVNNKIVIVGGSYESTKTAVNLFIRRCLDQELSEDKQTFNLKISSNYYEKVSYPVTTFKIGDTEAKTYRIVYSEKDSYAAQVFAKRLYYLICDRYGYKLELVKDPKDTSPCEIVVGETLSDSIDFDKENLHIECKEGKLYLACSFSAAYSYFYDYLNTKFLSASEIEYTNGEKEDIALSTLFTGGTENILQKNGGIRIMVNNIWSGNTENAPAALRAKQLADVYEDYAPDVLGLQEYSGAIKTNLSQLIKALGYVEVRYTEKNKNIAVQTPLFYNPDTVELINSGFFRYTDDSGDNSKAVSWGIFKEKATGRIFCAGSTHFYWTSDDLGKESRIIDANDLSALVKELVERYNCPVFIGGDYNCTLSSDPLVILKDNGLADVESIAEKTELNGTHHAYPVFDADTAICTIYYKANGDHTNAIDHMFGYNLNNVTVNTYDVVEDYFALASSDHCPILIDITLK